MLQKGNTGGQQREGEQERFLPRVSSSCMIGGTAQMLDMRQTT